MFVSSEFNGQFEEKLKNISHTTNIDGCALNVVNLLLFAEKIKSEILNLEKAFEMMTKKRSIN